MNKTTALILALGILAIVTIGFFAVFRGKGKFAIKSALGSAVAEGENPTTVPAGIDIGKVETKGGLRAQSNSEGGIRLGDESKIGGDIIATHSPGAPPPKR